MLTDVIWRVAMNFSEFMRGVVFLATSFFRNRIASTELIVNNMTSESILSSTVIPFITATIPFTKYASASKLLFIFSCISIILASAANLHGYLCKCSPL